MTPTQKGRRSDALYMDTRTTHRRQLCDMVVNREADIEDLKEEIYGLQCDIGRLENENAKLQKLVEGLNWHIETDGVCKDCPLGESPNSPFEVVCEQMMKEFGIEVNE